MAEAETLETKRVELDRKLAALKMSPAAADLVREADVAVAKHRAEADALESEIAVIDAALGVREMDRRSLAAQQRQDRWQAMRQELLHEEDARLQAIADAEQATRALVKAVDEILAANARMSKLAQELSANGKVPMALNPMDLVSRMANRIAAVMATIRGHRNRLGPLSWPAGASGLYPAKGQAWRDDEEQRMSRALIGPLLEKGKA